MFIINSYLVDKEGERERDRKREMILLCSLGSF